MNRRITTAFIGLPLLAFSVWFGTLWFSISIAVAAGIGALEFCHLAMKSGKRSTPPLAFVWSVSLVTAAHFVSQDDSDPVTLTSIGLASIAILFWSSIRIRPRMRPPDLGITIIAALYTGGMLAHAPLLRGLDDGRSWVYLFLLVIFTVDTSAFFVGRTLGKTPLAPTVSPKKTWEGAIAGFFAGTIATPAFAAIFAVSISNFNALILGALIGILGQTGDLLESKLKRIAGVKNSGWILPGHGGMLDRLDSIVLTLPLVYYFILWTTG